MNARLHLRIAALALVGIAAGCSSDGDKLDQVKDTLPEIAAFTASPSPVDFGDGSTLSWKTTGARRVVVSAGTVVLLDTTSEPNGLLEVTPQRTTTYSLRAISPAGETTSEARVEVRPTILELTTAAGDGPAVIGKPLAVSWRTGAALEVTLTNDADFSQTFTGAQALQGWVEAPVTATGTFTLTARSGELEVSQTITVDAIELDVPTIASFESDLLFVTRGNQESVEVSWSVAGATELRLFVNLEPFPLGDSSLEEDSISLVVNETTELVLIAKNLAGEAEATLRIVAQPLPSIVSLQAFPARVPAGAGTSLVWVTEHASRVELEADGMALELGELAPSGSAEIASIPFDTTYLLRAFNDAGASSESTVEVTIGAPEILAFGSLRPNVAQSVPVDLQWEVLGGTQLTVLDSELAPIDGCITIDVREIRAGGCQVVSPAELGTYVYTLSVRDSSSQEARQEFTLRVVDGPTIESFVASASRIAPGESVTLSWTTRTDASGNVPSLTLLDDRGGSYSLAGKDPAEDTVEITPDGVGTYVFTLAASTSGTTPAEASVSLLVEALAVALAGPDEYDPALAESMELGWTQTDAISLTIWALDDEGAPIEPAVFSEENPAVSGTVTIDPAATTTYRAVVENAVGSQAQAEHTIRVIGPEIITFNASPTDILTEQVSTLSWTTANTTSVRLDPPASYSIRNSTAPYIAVSERATSTHLDHAGNTCGGTGTPACPLLVFPAGFTFTYNGHTYDRANVFQSGFISFDLNRDNSTTPTSLTTQRLPVNPSGGANATGWTELIAPFWAALNMPAGAGIHYELIEGDPRGRYLAIEWHGMTQGSGRTVCNTPLGINLLLWEDGGFDFRYSMSVTDTSVPANQLCNGSGASIGFQHDLGEFGSQISYGKAQVGGIANKAWSMFPGSMGTDGMVDVLVPETQIFTLTATGARGRSVSQEITVRTHLPPRFTALTTDPVSSKDRNGLDVLLPIDVGTPGSIEWRTFNVVGVVVEDSGGNTVCPEATNAVPSGGCAISATTPGVHQYSVIGEDMMGNLVTQVVSFDFREPFRIDSLAATPDEIRLNNLTPVTLSWESVGATSFKVFADGVEVEGLTAADPNLGSVVVSPSRTTTYRLELTSADSRKQSAEVVATVRTFETGTITSPVTVTDGTQPVTIEWDTPILGGGRPMITIEPRSTPMVEVTNSPFIDISLDGDQLPGSMTTPGSNAAPTNQTAVVFPEGFTFPFFDEVLTQIYPATSGYLALVGNGNFNVPSPLLAWSEGTTWVHIAPFWDFLRSSGVGSIYTKYVAHPSDAEMDQFIVQWNKMQIGNGSDGSDDLTFQAGLYRDGSIEFRYKTMHSTRLPERAGGSGAAAGFHENLHSDDVVSAYRGYELFYKPANPINLTGRSFRYQALKPTDVITVTPEKTTEYNVCTVLEGFRECKTVVVVVPDAGNLMITELNLDPANGLAEQWIEVRNTTPYAFDIRGMTLTSDSSSIVVGGETPLVAASGQYLILAASEIAGLNPDYVYGTSFTMGTAVDTLKISYGTRQVAEAIWNPSWNVSSGRTLSLDPRWMRPHLLSNNDSSRWCDGGASGTPRTSVSCSSAHYDADPFSTRPFIDISETGTKIASMSGQHHQVAATTFTIPGGLGFTIPFFGVPVDSIWVSSNGFAGLSGSHEPLPITEPIPNPAGNGPGLIAPLWTPLHTTGNVYYERLTIGGLQVLVIQWHEVVRDIGTTQNNRPGNTTFQAQIWQNGDIVFSYGAMYAITVGTAGDLNPQQEHLGGVGTVGIEAIGGQQGFQYLHKEPILRKGQSIAYINKSGTGGR